MHCTQVSCVNFLVSAYLCIEDFILKIFCRDCEIPVLKQCDILFY